MPEFAYVARDLAGKRVSGRVEANTQNEVLAVLDQKALFPVTVSEEKKARRRGGRRVKPQIVATAYAQLADLLRTGQTERVRFASAKRVPAPVRQAAAASLQFIADAPVLAHGRIELLWYLREQSLSTSYHRYGNLGLRSSEERAPIA